jgi:hypothetical protein
MTFKPEAIDLAGVARELGVVFAGKPPVGYLLGRTALRDAVARFLVCSQLQAEQIVDTMIGRGFLKYEGSSSQEVDDLRVWWIAPQGLSSE